MLHQMFIDLEERYQKEKADDYLHLQQMEVCCARWIDNLALNLTQQINKSLNDILFKTISAQPPKASQQW